MTRTPASRRGSDGGRRLAGATGPALLLLLLLMALVAVLTAPLAPATAGPATRAQTEPVPAWPMIGRDAEHSGVASGPEPPFTIAWTSDVPANPQAAPVVAGDAVLIVGGSTVAALDAGSGELLWERERSKGRAGPAAVAGDLVVHPSADGDSAALVARGLRDGLEVWRASTGAAVVGGPTVAEGTIYLGTRAGEVLAIDAESGEIAWRFQGNGRVVTAPAVADGLVLAVSENLTDGAAAVTALDASSGDEEWRFSPTQVAAGVSAVAVADGVAYVGMGDGSVHALELESGIERWASRPSNPFRARSVPSIPGDVLVADLLVLHALNADTGEERWSYRLDDLLPAASPAVTGSWAVIGDASGLAAAIDVETGLLVWREDIGPGPIAAPAIDDERVYLTSLGEGGRVVALEHDPDGDLLAIPSPTKLFPVRALLNFAAAAALVMLGALALFSLLLNRPREAATAEAESAADEEEEG